VETAIYSLGGLRIASDFPLLGLPVCQDHPNCDVVVRYVPIAEDVASHASEFFDQQYASIGTDVVFNFPAVGRFLLRAGKEILIDLAPSADHDEVRAYLFGGLFPALCHQRGITPLHASAVNVEGGSVAFVGASGFGKSTLVATLAQRGHEVIADDLCFLQVSTNGKVVAWPGVGRIRLLEDAWSTLGFRHPDVNRETHGSNKYFVPVRPPQQPVSCRPLRQVYQLHRASDGVTEITRLYGADAVEVLIQNIYAPKFAERLGYKPRAFVACAAATRHVPVFRFSRPWDLAALTQSVELLENHMRTTS
jgi:hypothetical protein